MKKRLDGNLLRARRAYLNLSQEKAAAALKVTKQSISSWELGRTKPDPDCLMAMAQFYGCRVDDFYAEVEGEEAAA